MPNASAMPNMTHNRAAPPVTQGEGGVAVVGGVGVGKGDVTSGEGRAEGPALSADEASEVEGPVLSGRAPRSHSTAAAPSTTTNASASHRRGE